MTSWRTTKTYFLISQFVVSTTGPLTLDPIVHLPGTNYRGITEGLGVTDLMTGPVFSPQPTLTPPPPSPSKGRVGRRRVGVLEVDFFRTPSTVRRTD